MTNRQLLLEVATLVELPEYDGQTFEQVLNDYGGLGNDLDNVPVASTISIADVLLYSFSWDSRENPTGLGSYMMGVYIDLQSTNYMVLNGTLTNGPTLKAGLEYDKEKQNV